MFLAAAEPRDLQESGAGQMELLADGGRDTAASGLIDYATFKFRERADASVRCTGLGAD